MVLVMYPKCIKLSIKLLYVRQLVNTLYYLYLITLYYLQGEGGHVWTGGTFEHSKHFSLNQLFF